MYKCYVCKQYLPTANFHKDSSRKTGVGSRCKECQKERSRAIRATPEGKAQRVVQMRRWKRANKEKEQAHKRVARAIRSGKLVKPTRCSQCSSNEKIEGHHYDYDKPLDVIWVCQPCHNNIHREKYNAAR